MATRSTTRTVAAVDIGASSGRVMLATVSETSLELREVHRFGNGGVRVGGRLQWDVLALYQGVLEGLRRAARLVPRIHSVGIDTWAVDYGLLDADGQLLGNPVHYRDARTAGVSAVAAARAGGAAELYRRTGIQDMPFNTVNQLIAEEGSARLGAARTLLLLPDLLAYWLTGGPDGGAVGSEVTNASTTQLLDARTRTWDTDLARRMGIDPALLPRLREPGDVLGRLSAEVLAHTGLEGPVPVIAVGSHDTASAVVGTPGEGSFAYVSSGTWSLVGVELMAPLLTEASRRANFTNEAGVDGTVRYLRNVMGLWLLQESIRTWRERGDSTELAPLLASAAAEPGAQSPFDVGDPRLLAPGDMPARIGQLCREAGSPVPTTPPQVVRAVVDALAVAHRDAVLDLEALTGRDVETIHIVGGGSQNGLLCQATADACGVAVVAGPVEATALGNILVQARANGVALHDLGAMRTLSARTQPVTRYEPSPVQLGGSQPRPRA